MEDIAKKELLKHPKKLLELYILSEEQIKNLTRQNEVLMEIYVLEKR
jgi:hypothetical protein